MARLLLLLLLLMPSQSFAMEKFSDFIQDKAGRMITGVRVTVYNKGTTTKSTIYSDNGVTLKANPFTNSSTDGFAFFYAANGRYDIAYQKTGYVFTATNYLDRVLFDQAEFSGGGGGGGSMAIGNTVTSGTASSLLYVGSGPVLSQASLSGIVIGNGASAPTAYGGVTCTNQVLRILSAAGAGTCVTITSAYVDTSILTTAATVTFAQGGTGLSTAADDTVMVSSGSAWIAKGLPDCTDTGGNHLNYTQSSNTFGCGTSGGSGTLAIGSSVGSGTAQKMLYVTGLTQLGQLSCSDGLVFTYSGGSLVCGSIAGNALLDGSVHTDTLAGTVVRGDILCGNSTPKWARLPRGSSGNVLFTNSSGDCEWGTVDAMSTSSTDTMTNKTYDAEATGNVLSIPIKRWYPAAGCNNATAGTVWDLPTSTPAVATCVTGSNIQKGVLAYADTAGGFSAQVTDALPADWTSTGGIDAKIYWTTTATSGNAKWSLSTACTAVAASATDDPSFNTANTATTAAPGTGSRVQTSAITALTLTGCTTATSMLLHLKLFRDGNDGSDTIAATANLIGVEITFRRAM